MLDVTRSAPYRVRSPAAYRCAVAGAGAPCPPAWLLVRRGSPPCCWPRLLNADVTMRGGEARG